MPNEPTYVINGQSGQLEISFPWRNRYVVRVRLADGKYWELPMSEETYKLFKSYIPVAEQILDRVFHSVKKR